MWEPFRLSQQVHLPHAKIVYDKSHVLRHAIEVLDETRRAEFFRQGAEARGLIRGKRWLLLRHWANLDGEERQTLRDLFALNRRLVEAYLLKEQLARLWTYTYEAAAHRFLTNWLLAHCGQRLPAFQKLGLSLMRHVTGILRYIWWRSMVLMDVRPGDPGACPMSRIRWMPFRLILSVLVCVLCAIPVDGAEETYVIGVADVLDIQVWDNKDLNQVVSVRPDGKISLPLAGEVQAAGLAVQQLQESLAELYARTVKGAIATVLVKEIKSRPVYFIGGFAKPGVEQLTRELTLLQAISIVGGLLPTADGDNGFIVRGERRIPINFTRLMQKGDISQNIKLEVGDSVVAPQADAVYVHGEVKTAGAIKSTGDLTVLKAISQAGGVTPLAATSRVEILRGQGEKKERIKVDLDRVMKDPNENPDIRLMPNDILFVPQRLF